MDYIAEFTGLAIRRPNPPERRFASRRGLPRCAGRFLKIHRKIEHDSLRLARARQTAASGSLSFRAL
jgi:hypothetical protein